MAIATYKGKKYRVKEANGKFELMASKKVKGAGWWFDYYQECSKKLVDLDELKDLKDWHFVVEFNGQDYEVYRSYDRKPCFIADEDMPEFKEIRRNFKIVRKTVRTESNESYRYCLGFLPEDYPIICVIEDLKRNQVERVPVDWDTFLDYKFESYVKLE